jgi:hypothetical protein
MTLSDGREVYVEYVVDDYGSDPSGMYGPPEDYDPGSGPELHIEKVSIDEGVGAVEIIGLPDAEIERLETEIAENPDWWLPDDDYGYDG